MRLAVALAISTNWSGVSLAAHNHNTLVCQVFESPQHVSERLGIALYLNDPDEFIDVVAKGHSNPNAVISETSIDTLYAHVYKISAPVTLVWESVGDDEFRFAYAYETKSREVIVSAELYRCGQRWSIHSVTVEPAPI